MTPVVLGTRPPAHRTPRQRAERNLLSEQRWPPSPNIQQLRWFPEPKSRTALCLIWGTSLIIFLPHSRGERVQADGEFDWGPGPSLDPVTHLRVLGMWYLSPTTTGALRARPCCPRRSTRPPEVTRGVWISDRPRFRPNSRSGSKNLKNPAYLFLRTGVQRHKNRKSLRAVNY